MSCATADTEVFLKGSTPVFRLTFYDLQGELVDPDLILVRITDPSGDSDEYESPDATIVASAEIDEPVGIYYFTKPTAVTEVGAWWLHVEQTVDSVVGVEERRFKVSGLHTAAPV